MVKLISVYDFAAVWFFVVFFQLIIFFIYSYFKKKYFINEIEQPETSLKMFFSGLNMGWFLFYTNFLVIFFLFISIYLINSFIKYKFKKENKILPEIIFGLFSMILLIYL